MAGNKDLFTNTTHESLSQGKKRRRWFRLSYPLGTDFIPTDSPCQLTITISKRLIYYGMPNHLMSTTLHQITFWT